MRLPFALQSYPADSQAVSQETLVNVFAERQPENARAPVILRSTPGIVQYAAGGTGPITAMAVQRSELWMVSGREVIAFTNGNIVAHLFGIEAGADPVKATIATSAAQVAICCPPYVYVFKNVNNSFQRLTVFSDTGTAVPGFGSVTYVDGLFIFGSLEPGGAFYFSRAGDALDVRAVDFVTTESNPDNIVRVADLAGEIWAFGVKSIEVWNATGGSTAVSRQLGAAIARGLGAFRSLVVLDNAFFFLGDDGAVYRTRGYQVDRVSTFALEQQILRYGDFPFASGVATDFAGHTQYRLNFPSGHTWVFDVQSGLWHEECSGAYPSRHRIESSARYNDLMLVGDLASGALGRLSVATALQFGVAPVRQFILPPVYREGRRLFMSRLELETDGDAAAGLGMAMDWSEDAGRTWGPSRAGVPGDGGRLVWHRLGSFRQRALRFRASPQVPFAIYGAVAELEEGAA